MWLWIRAWVKLFIRPFRHSTIVSRARRSSETNSTTGQKVKLSFTGSDGSLLGIKSDGKLTLWNPRLGGKPDPEYQLYREWTSTGNPVPSGEVIYLWSKSGSIQNYLTGNLDSYTVSGTEKSPADCCKWKIVSTMDVFRQTPYNSPDNDFMLHYYGSNRPPDTDLFFAIMSIEYDPDRYRYQLKSKSSAASFSFVQ